MQKQFGILLARQRSGTGAVGTVLDKHNQVKYLGEIFHPGNVGNNNNFFTYKKQAAAKDLSILEPNNSDKLIEGFLEWRKSIIGAQLPIIDVKYNSLHHLASPWLEPSARPWILTHCIKNKFPIIHLTRENYLFGYISGRLAEANQVWHARSDDEIKVEKVEIDSNALLQNFRSTQASVNLIREWLGKRHFVLEIEYSKIFDADGSLTHTCTNSFEDLLDIDPFTDTKPVFVKQNKRSIEDSIANYDQVYSALMNSEFAWMLEA